jgi:phytoene synthase
MDAFAFAADEVRAHDRVRYLADLYAPEPKRRYLFALHAFNNEIARIREVVSDPLPGEIRLQWWRDVITGEGRGEAAGNPLAAALLETIGLNDLPKAAFDNWIEAKIFDLYDDPMPTLRDAAGHAGVAQAITGLLRALPYHARRGQLFLPADLMAKHGITAAEIFALKSTPNLQSLLAELRTIARGHFDKARSALPSVESVVLPAFLPLATVEPLLRRMERRGYDPLNTIVELPPWQAPWSIWRAARRGSL